MLDVERHTVDNPLDYLDKRFDDIESNKKAAITTFNSASKVTFPKVYQSSTSTHDSDDSWYPDYSFKDYLREKEMEDGPT